MILCIFFQISKFWNIDGMIAKFFELKFDIGLKMCFEKRANEKKLVDQLGVDFVNEDTHVLEETKYPALPIKSIIYRVCI